MPQFKLKTVLEGNLIAGESQVVTEGVSVFQANMGDVRISLDVPEQVQDDGSDLNLCEVVIPARVFLANFEAVDERGRLALRNIKIAADKVERDKKKAEEEAAKNPPQPQPQPRVIGGPQPPRRR